MSSAQFTDLPSWFRSVLRPDLIRIFHYHGRLMWWDDTVAAPVPEVLRSANPVARNMYQIKGDKFKSLPGTMDEPTVAKMVARLTSMGKDAVDPLHKGEVILGGQVQAQSFWHQGDTVHLQASAAQHLDIPGTTLFTNKPPRMFITAKTDSGEVMAAAAIFKVNN